MQRGTTGPGSGLGGADKVSDKCVSHCTRLREVASGPVKAKFTGRVEENGGGGSGRLNHEGRPGPFGPRVGPRVGSRVKVRVSAKSNVRTWARVGARARCMVRWEGCAGQRTPHRTFHPRTGAGVVDRVRVRGRGRAPDKVGAWAKAGRGVANEVRARDLSVVRVRGGVTVRICLGTRERAKGRDGGRGNSAKKVTDVPRGRSPTSGSFPGDRSLCPHTPYGQSPSPRPRHGILAHPQAPLLGWGLGGGGGGRYNPALHR